MSGLADAGTWRAVIYELSRPVRGALTTSKYGNAPDNRRPSTRARRSHPIIDNVTIGLIEWTDSRSVILSWRGATTGYYAEQVWKLNKARKPGRCALSGCAVRRGDPVFRPSYRKRNLPGNAEYVVCEHAMRRFCIRSSGN